jgi:hypothetical protein
MDWTPAHKAQMKILLTQPEGVLPGGKLSYYLAQDLIVAGYAARNRRGAIFPTPLGRRAWREGRAL